MSYSPYYGDWSSGWKPSGSSVAKKYRSKIRVEEVHTSNTIVEVHAYLDVNINSKVNASFGGFIGANNHSSTNGKASTSFDKGDLTVNLVSKRTYKWNRTHSQQKKDVYGHVWSGKGSWGNEDSEVYRTITIPALPHRNWTFNPNGGTGGSHSITKWYGEKITADTVKSNIDKWGITRVGYSLKGWDTNPNATNPTYKASFAISENTTQTTTKDIYAIWQPANPPECDYSPLKDFSLQSDYTKSFSEIGVTIDTDSIVVHSDPPDDERRFKNAVITVGGDSSAPMSLSDLETYNGDIKVTPRSSGKGIEVTLTLQDEIYENGAWVDGAVQDYDLGEIDIDDPVWNAHATFDATKVKIPDKDGLNNSAINVYADWYDNGWHESGGNPDYTQYEEIITTYNAVDNGDDTWSIDVPLTERYVSNPSSATPDVRIHVIYNHTDAEEKPYRTAFFNTSRNANYSNGIYNNVFVSGCDDANYSSRVWWCYVNNPLYFPDTNYVEVGSNDTSVMGLIKVGDYLGAIKQSKTTDTAIYLLYPTSFEEDTTYAVKQGVQGVGALSKYAFNILGDETLFLSPRGVMAIVPSQDEEHKVQNRSYFIDKKLLNEENIDKAYSFVFDGKYYLAVNGHCYVLDGNQRNSWGNDKTNLVYECYYLENIPADCFVKFQDTLMFSNFLGLCRVKKETDGGAYVDAYNMKSQQEEVPVTARWSTVFDDDGSVNYYKTMQKKGNAVSVLPNNPFRYEEVEITEDEFNAKKTDYFIRGEGGYVRCTEDSVFDDTATYYIRMRYATKVFIRKDLKEPVEIKREFGDATEIPSELFVNKKFKKYKRLQFILVNEEDEPFGVDSIVKQYTVGNYAKR